MTPQLNSINVGYESCKELGYTRYLVNQDLVDEQVGYALKICEIHGIEYFWEAYFEAIDSTTPQVCSENVCDRIEARMLCCVMHAVYKAIRKVVDEQNGFE